MAPVAAEERSEAAIVIFGFNCYAANILWERACSRWQHIVPPDTARCLHRGQARLLQRKYVGRLDCF